MDTSHPFEPNRKALVILRTRLSEQKTMASILGPAGKTYTSAREGAAFLIRGAMMAVRNLVSHPEWPNPSEAEALEMLAVLSYVAHLVDRAELVK